MGDARYVSRATTLLAALLLALALAGGQAFAQDGDSAGQDAAAQLAAGQVGETGQAAAEKEELPAANPHVKYKAYVGASWGSKWKRDGASVGSASKQLQLVKVKVAGDGLGGSIKYRVYSRHKGWLKWARSGKLTGTKGWYIRGIQMKLTGELSKQFDVAYRVYLDGDGWQPWTVNGATSGSTGKLGPIQKFQVKLMRKKSTQRIAEGAYFITPAKAASTVLALPNSEAAEGARTAKKAFDNEGTYRRFYVRSCDNGGITLQSCASGLYLCDADGKVVQKASDGSAAFSWNVSKWNGGYTLTNAGTGRKMKFQGGKAVTSGKGSRWAFTPTDVLADGTYTLATTSKGTYLAVKGDSLKNKAKLVVRDKEQTNAEVFEFARTSKNTYRITNVNSGKRVEVANGSGAQKAAVRQNRASSGNLQKWKVGLSSDGTLRLVNKASKKALSALRKGASGAYVRSCTDKATGAQRWIARETEPYQDTAEMRAERFADSIGSFTNYFITVDLSNHWVCVFSGKKGSRTLEKSWPCSTGASDSPTPTGEYTTDYKQYEFGDGYSCYYATAFIGYTYLFHSVPYYKDTFTIKDGRLGQSVSEGCVRLSIDNARWIYNNIPSGTKVKIYY